MRTIGLPVFLGKEVWFPDIREEHAGRRFGDLVAVGGDLSPERLLLAYRKGLFPWTVNPVTWWSPKCRAIFDMNSFHVPRSLQRLERRGTFEVTVDKAFREVMLGCVEPAPGRGETWITPSFIEAYTRLHELGHAHSVECWKDGLLAGGIYGVAIGGLFAGESMFHRVSNTSKLALWRLIDRLKERGFRLFDIQMLTPVTESLGAFCIPRNEYLDRLAEAVEARATF